MYHRHGLTHTPEYTTWRGMRIRCNNPSHKSWSIYGGKGIKLCERWNDFENFYEDMGPKPDPSYSIDRLDNDKGYSKENCRWATKEQQTANRVLVPPRGERCAQSKLKDPMIPEIREKHKNGASVRELAVEYSVSETTIYNVVKNITWRHITRLEQNDL